MDEIADVIQEIVKGCAAEGVHVSELLAAFVCRTIIEKSDQDGDVADGRPAFSLDKKLSGDDINELINRCIERLMEQDSPSLETIKMQVSFDSSYLQEDEKISKKKQTRKNQNRELERGIVVVRPQNANDYDTLTSLYRQIFNFLLQHFTPEAATERSVEREVAAALESVFPRIGLKAFIQLTNDEKYEQLEELASIVLGIRLFNRKVGKGGAGIPAIDDEVTSWLESMTQDLSLEVEMLTGICQQQQETIVHLHLRSPKGVTREMMDRWKDELANRRQYLSYLQSLQEDVAVSSQKVNALVVRLRSNFNDNLAALIGARTSVPKEHVYPKFDALARTWAKLDGEHKARRRTPPAPPPRPCPPAASRRQGPPPVPEDKRSWPSHLGLAERSTDGGAGSEGGAEGKAGAGPAAGGGAEGKDGGGAGGEAWPAEGKGGEGGGGGPGGERPVRLSIESTPEFMQLPLEFQGFCPWTICHRRGLLLPGRPELGVVRYRNSFYVFAHEVRAGGNVYAPPPLFRLACWPRPWRSPELIHLLRLQHCFPRQSIARLLRGGGGPGEGAEEGVFLAAAPAEKK
ncbi:unnamed protein product, partial [Heterosigma akashiwo]